MDRVALESKIEFLLSRRAHRVPHLAGSLLDHLLGTHALLHAWTERVAVCDAGLFHSVYGTESFPHTAVPLHLRARVTAVIGPEAERLAYLFGAMARASLYDASRLGGAAPLRHRLTGQRLDARASEIVDLYHLTAANWLEQRPHVPRRARQHRRDDYLHMRRHLRPSARAAVDTAYGFCEEHAP